MGDGMALSLFLDTEGANASDLPEVVSAISGTITGLEALLSHANRTFGASHETRVDSCRLDAT